MAPPGYRPGTAWVNKSAVTDKSKLAGVIQTLLLGQEEDEEKRSVLHGKLVRLAKQIAAVAAGVALVTLGVLVIRQVMVEKTEEEAKAEQQAKAYVPHMMTAVTVLVVAIPEGPPLTVTVSLAYSVKETMADHNLVRHPHACETMGNASTICTNKTGTPTTNRMAVVRAFLCREERGQGASQTSLVTSLPAQARELLGQAVAYNSSYSSRPEERDGLATQGDIEQKRSSGRRMNTSMALHQWGCRGSSSVTLHGSSSSTAPHSTVDAQLRTRLAPTVPTVATVPTVPTVPTTPTMASTASRRMPVTPVWMPVTPVRMPETPGMPVRTARRTTGRMERRCRSATMPPPVLRQ